MNLGVRRTLVQAIVRLRDRLDPPLPAPSPPTPADTVPPPLRSTASTPSPFATQAAVEAILDDMVRPALQMDGGDIELVDINGSTLTVRLVGACRSCPSAQATMRDGVERLLKEEFPSLETLIAIGVGSDDAG